MYICICFNPPPPAGGPATAHGFAAAERAAGGGAGGSAQHGWQHSHAGDEPLVFWRPKAPGTLTMEVIPYRSQRREVARVGPQGRPKRGMKCSAPL